MARSLAGCFALLRGCSLALLAVGCAEGGQPDATQLFADPHGTDPHGADPRKVETFDAPEVLGGQSGTEGGQDYLCEPLSPRNVTPDEVLPLFGFTLRQVAASLEADTLMGRWLSAGAAQLMVELDLSQGARELALVTRDGQLCDTTLEVDALHVRSSDGSIDALVPARITRGDFEVTLDAALPALPAAVLGPAHALDVAAVRPLLERAPYSVGPALRISLVVGDGMRNAALYDESGPRGVWQRDPAYLPWGAPTPFTPAPLLAGACTGAVQAQADTQLFTPYANGSAALAGVAKVWARCLDSAPTSHAGIEISPDGKWRRFDVEAGELVARSGFGNEGYVKLLDTSAMNGPGFFQLELPPFGRNYDSPAPVALDYVTVASEQALVFQLYGAPEDWHPAVYQPTALGVRSLESEFAEGERAGSAACDRPEHGLVFDSAQAAPLLSGEFVLCSGSLHSGVVRLRFAPEQVELLAADGSVLSTRAFTPASGAVQLDGYTWSLTVSRQPLKVLVGEQLEHGGSSAVFSAVP